MSTMSEQPPLKKRMIARKRNEGNGIASRFVVARSDSDEVPAQDSMVLQQQVEDSLRLLDPEETAAYWQARRVAPHLVMTESNVSTFLRCENGNVDATARRLAAYWTQRKDIFGESRAFRALTDLSGDGALNPQDVSNLYSGITAKLPVDEQGRTVLCVDRSRLESLSDKVIGDSHLRINFYWFQIAAENPLSQTAGFSLLHVMKKPAAFDRVKLQRTIALVREAMPIKFSSFHLCCIPPPGGRKAFTDMIIPITLQMLGNIDGKKASAHLANSEGQMADMMAPHGFSKVSLPTTLGGIWTYDKFSAWLRQRLRSSAEAEVPVAAASQEVVEEQQHSTMDNLVQAADIAILSERKARKRSMDAIYARKRRERERGEEDKIKDQCFLLSKENLRLEEDNQKLELLLKQAKEQVMLHEQREFTARRTGAARIAVQKHQAQVGKGRIPINESTLQQTTCALPAALLQQQGVNAACMVTSSTAPRLTASTQPLPMPSQQSQQFISPVAAILCQQQQLEHCQQQTSLGCVLGQGGMSSLPCNLPQQAALGGLSEQMQQAINRERALRDHLLLQAATGSGGGNNNPTVGPPGGVNSPSWWLTMMSLRNLFK